ncbi:MAG: cell division protein ZapA [Candidatus Cardinium sp.]|nr:cell division protein ZapA [Candidatus Cardinium sp.]
MTALSIKIKIADRMYPMKVASANEAAVRKAGKLLEERISSYQKKLRIQDQQDLLAMVAFDCLVESLQIRSTEATAAAAYLEKVALWSRTIEKAMQC